MQPYLGEIRMFAGTFAPVGWALCQGQSLPISENEALFAIIGTTYGGDGVSTFNMPDMRGRAPLHQGQGAGLTNYEIGTKAGVETVTLVTAQMPSHNHGISANSLPGTASVPTNAFLAKSADADLNGLTIYTAAASNQTMSPQSLSIAGGSQPHGNMQPYLAINFIIALQGVFPTRD